MVEFNETLFNETLNKAIVLCIVTKTQGSAPGKPGMKMMVYEDGTIQGSVGGGAIEKEIINKAIEMMYSNAPQYYSFNLKNDLYMECGGMQDIYMEPLNPKCKLYIFGAGHIGKALAGFGKELSFDITLIDERENIFDDFTDLHYHKMNLHFEEAIKQIEFDKRSFIVIVTHKHIHDADILKLLCNKTYAYLGMIGSKKKVEKIKNELIENNITTSDIINNIDSPIGLKFKSITHKEIAISILAKIIDVRNRL